MLAVEHNDSRLDNDKQYLSRKPRQIANTVIMILNMPVGHIWAVSTLLMFVAEGIVKL